MNLDKKWLDICVDAGEFLYGFYPLSVLKQMVETKEGVSVSEEELLRAVDHPRDYMMHYHSGKLLESGRYGEGYLAPARLEGTQFEAMMREDMQDGNPYAGLHIDEQARTALLKEQGDLDFYIPTEREILEVHEDLYIRTPAMTELEEKIAETGGDPEKLHLFWRWISAGRISTNEAVSLIIGLFDVCSLTAGRGSASEQIAELNRLTPLVINFINSVNLRSMRGYSPNALSGKMAAENAGDDPRIMDAAAGFRGLDKVVSTNASGERRVIKIGRNDPCPCGSGKKYKKCCGR